MDDDAVLCVGLVCLDIVAETENFPIEDTDQRFIFKIIFYFKTCRLFIECNFFCFVCWSEFLIFAIVVVGMHLIQVQFLLSLDWSVNSLEI